MTTAPVHESNVQSAINVTPLVDVCLVLLIIFMVVTPMMNPGAQVAVPQTARPERLAEIPKPIEIALHGDGRIFLNGSLVDRLVEQLRPLVEAAPQRPIVIKADRSLPYRMARALMQAVSEAGGKGAGLVTDRK